MVAITAIHTLTQTKGFSLSPSETISLAHSNIPNFVFHIGILYSLAIHKYFPKSTITMFDYSVLWTSYGRMPEYPLYIYICVAAHCSQQTNSKFSLLPSIKSERVSSSVYFCAANLSCLCLRSDFDWRTNISSVLINDQHQNLLIGCLLLVT